jgi:hypothetical protein
MNRGNYLLHGKATCGCCGYALVYNNPATSSKYRCVHTLADKNAECHKLNVNANELEEAVIAIIKKQAAVVLDSEDLSGIQKKGEIDQMTTGVEEQIRYWVEQRQKNFEKFILNDIDRDEHKKSMNECSEQLERLNHQLSIIKQTVSDKQESKKVAAAAQEALVGTASQKDIVNALVDKILISPGDRFEIRWRFVNFAMGL